MDTVYYLLHSTDKYNENWTELKTSKIEDYEDQFPGVYFTLVTADNIQTERFYSGNYFLLFSKKLLEQKNYHMNLKDYNGYISENNTYFPWNLQEGIAKLNQLAKAKKSTTNEIVFHDPIPMSYCCAIIKSFPTISISKTQLLPTVAIENEVEPDTTKEPFFCYPLEKNYTGMGALPESSRDFFVKMANTCHVDSQLSTDEIIEKIKEKIPYLYSHRTEQHLEALKTSRQRTSKPSVVRSKKTRKTRK